MRFSLIILLLGLSYCLSAQFNVAVGYSLGYTPADQINKLVFDFNESFRSDGAGGAPIHYGQQMPDLHILHGMNVGMRWKYDLISFELNWERMNRTREAIGETITDVLYQKTVFYNLNSYSAGLESNFGSFGLGIALGLRNFEIKEQIASTKNKRSFLEDRQYFIKPSISINLFGGDNMGIAIRPYLQIPLSSIPLNALSQDLIGEDTSASEPFWVGGISIIIYNGSQ